MRRQEILVAVIDDDDPFRTALIESLCSFGYGVRAFASGEEFLTANTEEPCDCVITDIQMPGMSGYDLQRQIATNEAKSPVIMITARADSGLEAKALAHGALCLLRKPFEVEALIDCLKKALEFE